MALSLKRELTAPAKREQLFQSQSESDEDTIGSGRAMLGVLGLPVAIAARWQLRQTGAKDRDGRARGGLHRKSEMAGGQATLAAWLKQ